MGSRATGRPLSSNPSMTKYGRCTVCAADDCEVDDGGYLFCPTCGAREALDGRYLPVRHDERDYSHYSRQLEQCPYCYDHNISRRSDDLVRCLSCHRMVLLPVPNAWLAPGAVCRIDRCQVPG